MDDFWLGRWQRGETGWHQDEVEPALIKWVKLHRPSRILVPLCGKSLDLVYLASQGFEVIGVELSQLACEAFFSENKIDHQILQDSEFRVYQGRNIKIYNGDFFKLTKDLLGPVQYVYDRAALIALPETLRAQYSLHLMDLTHAPEILQILIARTPYDEMGPPFSVQPQELEKLYGSHYQIKLQSREQVTARAPEGSLTHEYVFYSTIRD